MRIDRVPSGSPQRLGQEDLLVQYSLPNGQVMVVRLEKSNPTEADIERAVREDAARFINVLGKTLQL